MSVPNGTNEPFGAGATSPLPRNFLKYPQDPNAYRHPVATISANDFSSRGLPGLSHAHASTPIPERSTRQSSQCNESATAAATHPSTTLERRLPLGSPLTVCSTSLNQAQTSRNAEYQEFNAGPLYDWHAKHLSTPRYATCFLTRGYG